MRGSIRAHPTAGDTDLPLLVPAFSSKGFGFRHTGRGKTKRRYSEIAYELAEFGKRPSRAVLVSAYDIHHGHFGAPDLTGTSPFPYLKNAALVFIDSGGYELSPDFDSSEPRQTHHETRVFAESHYLEVLDQLAALRRPPPLVIANFDHGRTGEPLVQQIRAARTLFNRFPMFASDFIIKPWKGKYIDPRELSPRDISNLRGFHVIGLAEKELARDLFDRIKRVAELRRRLDDEGISAPIHVWGGLEPVSTPLLFFAGASIFDGISWLRYAYHGGFAIARESYCVVSATGVTADRLLNHYSASIDNLTALEKLTIALQQWVDLDGKDFSVFHADVKDSFREAYRAMLVRISTITGDR